MPSDSDKTAAQNHHDNSSWISLLQATDTDALKLEHLDVASLAAQDAARDRARSQCAGKPVRPRTVCAELDFLENGQVTG